MSNESDALIGREMGGYRLMRRLGQGGMGTVYVGESVSNPGEQVAIKILQSDGGGSTASREAHKRFAREAQALRELRHPHILELLGYGQDEATGRDYMVLRYITSGTLADRISTKGPLPLVEASSILTQVAEALDFAHGRNIIHRDLKPANLLLDEAGNVYLADFGIAKLVDMTTLHTQAFTGTPHYMSPEQINGDPISPASDVFSLGILLYQMVTGILPFDGLPQEVYGQIPRKTPDSPLLARSDLTKPGEATIMKALAKDPVARFASAGEMAHAFEMSLSDRYAPGLVPYAPPFKGEATGGPTVNLLRPFTTALGQRPQRTGVMAVLSLVVIAGLAFTLWGRGNHSTSRASTPLAVVTGTAHATHAPAPTVTATKVSNSGGSGGNGGGPGGGGPGGATATMTPPPTHDPGVPPPATPTFTPVPPTPTFTPIPHYYETTGGVTHTWTNYNNAGGTQGPSISTNQTVEVACRLTGFRVADGNTWWYRIASGPWNYNYYASADAFYNNGATSGPLNNTPFVDTSVPLC